MAETQQGQSAFEVWLERGADPATVALSLQRACHRAMSRSVRTSVLLWAHGIPAQWNRIGNAGVFQGMTLEAWTQDLVDSAQRMGLAWTCSEYEVATIRL